MDLCAENGTQLPAPFCAMYFSGTREFGEGKFIVRWPIVKWRMVSQSWKMIWFYELRVAKWQSEHPFGSCGKRVAICQVRNFRDSDTTLFNKGKTGLLWLVLPSENLVYLRDPSNYEEATILPLFLYQVFHLLIDLTP